MIGLKRISTKGIIALFSCLMVVACSDESEVTSGTTGGNTSRTAVAQSRYEPANACYMLRSGSQYVSQKDGGYAASSNQAEAARFYFKATALGSYLLLSHYERGEGTLGSKELLGITDPAGEFLDELGNFIGETGYLVSAAGDMSEYFTDPVFLPALGAAGVSDADAPRARDPGELAQTADDALAGQNISPELGLVTEASDLAVWVLDSGEKDHFTLASAVTGQYLTVGEGVLGLSAPGEAGEQSQLQILPTTGCNEYPEAELNAVVAKEGPAIYLREVPMFAEREVDEDDIFGFVDTHSHISAYEFIGGRLNYGDPFHKFGVDHALKNCEEHHGPQGMTGLTNQFISGPGPHDTQGWPSFNDWPVHHEKLHHQSYYMWLKRAHLAGMKLMVEDLVHNEILCQLNPQKENDCDAMPAIELQAKRIYEMQDYIDAQNGGPGQGWFRIVTSPAQARQVIGDGKLAVILGVEMSKVLNCGEFQDVPECTKEQVVERLDRLYDLGVRDIYPVHKFDNAFGGHLPDLGSGVGLGPVLYLGNFSETGHPIEFETCPEALADDPDAEYTGTETDQNERDLSPLGLIDQMLFHLDYMGDRFPTAPEEFAEFDPRAGTGNLCNRRGLTELGEFLVYELMKRKMFIETDHISRKAAARILEITAASGYSVVNSHGGWGGTQAIRDRIARQGGMSSSFARGSRDGWVDTLLRDGGRPRADTYKVAGFGPTGFASDVNGIASLPGQPGEEDPDLYPFTSIDGRVTFGVQKTGDRTFGLYDGRGVAHYGLYPDLIADMVKNSERSPEEIEQAIGSLFTSAEGYLRLWERMEATQVTTE